MKKLFAISAALLVALCGIGGAAIVASAETLHEENFDVAAKSAILMDYDTGKIVYAKNEKSHLPIASMVKIMTLLLTFEEIDSGRMALSDSVTASENAASMGGSQAFLDSGSNYVVEELIKSIVVGSANDSCVAMAERISGSVEAFVSKMNCKAKELGMEDTVFVNCTGLPGAEQYCCARDAAIMMRALLKHSAFYDYSGIWMFDFVHPSGRITQLANTNKLLRGYEGCDGGKTGFTNEAKYCLAATAKRGDTRLISVVCGAESSKVRNAQNAKLFNYGFANYETKRVVHGGIPLEEEYAISGGKEKTVKAVPAEDRFVFSKKGDVGALTYKAEMLASRAPIKQGEVIGLLTVSDEHGKVCEVNLLSDRDVEKSTYMDIVDEFIANW